MRTMGTPVNAMVIKGDGNVGIGTASPGMRLEVENTASTTPLRIQDSSNTCDFGVDASGWASISCSSDESLKSNITEVPQSTFSKIADWVFNYPLKEFNWNSNGERTIGAIAQDIQKLDSTKVKNMTNSYFDEELNKTIEETYLSVEVPTTLDLLIAIQQQQKEIENQNLEIIQLKAENQLIKLAFCKEFPQNSLCNGK